MGMDRYVATTVTIWCLDERKSLHLALCRRRLRTDLQRVLLDMDVYCLYLRKQQQSERARPGALNGRGPLCNRHLR